MTGTATEHLDADPQGIARAAALLRAGANVAFPTETVYGLGGDARSESAVAGIYAAKGRPAHNPLIVHVADIAAAEALVDLGDEGRDLAQAFWPGPLTIVAPMRPGTGIAAAVAAGKDTLAVRVPVHPVARAVLASCGRPVAAPSANRSGRVSPTSAAHVRADLDGRIAAVLDGGPCDVGLESTILAVNTGVRLLRPGAIPAGAIEAALGKPLLRGPAEMSAPVAPGLLASHYAPRAAVRLNAETTRPGEVLLGFGPVPGSAANLSASGDLHEAARNLFSLLRELDRPGVDVIAVSPIPQTGLGAAINDRLRRAAAPRG